MFKPIYKISNLSYLLLLPLFFFMNTQMNAQCVVSNGGNIGENQTIASGATPAQLESNMAANGASGTIEYLWMFTTSPGQGSNTTWIPINSATSATYQPPALGQTTYYIRCARIQGCTEYTAESNIIQVEVNGALPVELIDFDAKVKGNTVELNWVTLSELNHNLFQVEHSTDNITFATINTIRNTSGDSDTRKVYVFQDKNAVAGNNYYRLRQEDKDGRTTFSNVISAKVTLTQEVNIAPNPVSNLMTVKMSELLDSPAVLTFVSLQTGAVVRRESLASRQASYRLETEDLAPGMYLLQVISMEGKSLAAQRFMKAGR